MIEALAVGLFWSGYLLTVYKVVEDIGHDKRTIAAFVGYTVIVLVLGALSMAVVIATK